MSLIPCRSILPSAFLLITFQLARPGRPVIGDVLFHGLALTKQALDNSLSETGIAIRFSESVYLFRSPGTCYSGPSKSVKQSVHRFR